MNAVATLPEIAKDALLNAIRGKFSNATKDKVGNALNAIKESEGDNLPEDKALSILTKSGFEEEISKAILSNVLKAAETKNTEGIKEAACDAKDTLETQATEKVSGTDDLVAQGKTELKNLFNEINIKFLNTHKDNFLSIINGLEKNLPNTEPEDIESEKMLDELKSFQGIIQKEGVKEAEIVDAFKVLSGASKIQTYSNLSTSYAAQSQAGTGAMPTLNTLKKKKTKLFDQIKSFTGKILEQKKSKKESYNFKTGSINDFEKKSEKLFKSIKNATISHLQGNTEEKIFRKVIENVLNNEDYSADHIELLLTTIKSADAPSQEKEAGIINSAFNFAKDKIKDPKTLMAVIPAVSYGVLGFVEMIIGPTFITRLPKALIGKAFGSMKDLVALYYIVTNKDSEESPKAAESKEDTDISALMEQLKSQIEAEKP